MRSEPRSVAPEGTSHVTVSWPWHHQASHYRIQLANDASFQHKVVTRTSRNEPVRPPGGRQAAVINHLARGASYWARVRQYDAAHHRSHWSAPVRLQSKAQWPASISKVGTSAGPGAGETTIRWNSEGNGKTDMFRVVTALTPFPLNGEGTDQQGWNKQVFTVPGNARSLTLTPEQTAAAGAGLGSGRTLLFRLYAVRKGKSDSQVRGYAHIAAATVAGQAPTMTGSPIRVANYNVRLAALDAGSANSWAVRAPLVAQNFANYRPAVAAVEELIPPMWDSRSGGPGLGGALNAAGLGSYSLTRTTAYTDGMIGDTRILYDTNKLQLVSQCDDQRPSCGFVFPDVNNKQSVASYAQFRDLASGVRFWFVAAHLAHGNTAAVDALRAREVQTIVSQLNAVNTEHLAVILAGDLNSYQTCPGRNAPQQALLDSGFYDTAAAVRQVNMAYNTSNQYAGKELPSPNGFGARLDEVLTQGMPGADRFEIVRTGAPYPSDHNMVVTDLRLPAA